MKQDNKNNCTSINSVQLNSILYYHIFTSSQLLKGNNKTQNVMKWNQLGHIPVNLLTSWKYSQIIVLRIICHNHNLHNQIKPFCSLPWWYITFNNSFSSFVFFNMINCCIFITWLLLQLILLFLINIFSSYISVDKMWSAHRLAFVIY